MEQANTNEIPMSKCLRAFPHTNSDVICELAYEYKEVSSNLGKLKKAIEADPQAVCEHHKDLWRKQAKAMHEYINILGERIKDLIDSDTSTHA